MNTIRKLVLFDIDGTLVLTGGAGIRAMNRACEELVGHGQALANIPVAGRTDRIILTDVVRQAGHDLDDGLLEQLRDRYLVHLREEIERPGRTQNLESFGARGGIKAVMPGIRELLDTLAQRADVFLGLLTGNFEAGARIKLEPTGLRPYFRLGAYGSDHIDRRQLPSLAARRAQALIGRSFQPEAVVVIGDTPHDIECARHFGAIAVAVATGLYTRESLEAERPDLLFDDFSDVEAAFAKLLPR